MYVNDGNDVAWESDAKQLQISANYAATDVMPTNAERR